MELWKGRTDFTGVIRSPLIGFMKLIDFADTDHAGYKWDWKIDEQTAFGYIGQVIAWMRLTWLQEPHGGFDGVGYWASKVLLWDALPENLPAENAIGFYGEDLLKVFAMKLDPNERDAEYKKAEDVVWKMLAQSVLQKITHGKGLTHSLHCGTLLDMPENEGKDAEPGTFGELLRYGSVHFEQMREMEYIVAPVVEAEVIIRKGVLEP